MTAYLCVHGVLAVVVLVSTIIVNVGHCTNACTLFVYNYSIVLFSICRYIFKQFIITSLLACLPTLSVPDRCPELIDPANGIVVQTGLNATYVCDSDSQLIGEGTRTCYNGEWSGESPICRRKYMHDSFSYYGVLIVVVPVIINLGHCTNACIQFTADSQLPGEGAQSCANNGEPSGESPACIRKFCVYGLQNAGL